MSTRLVSIGVPVYNGANGIQRALDTLLAQTHTNIELIISDNASTDEVTQRITSEYARRDPRIRLTRQPVNQGGTANFIWVLQQARGDYFMWAAHDDWWSENYVEQLANRLDNAADACLATSQATVVATGKHGETKISTVPAAPNADRWATIDVYSQYSAGTWFYGLYRTEWIRQNVEEIQPYPYHCADRIWMFGKLLTERVVGDSASTFFYTSVFGRYKDLTWRVKMQSWGTVLFHTTRLAWTRLPMSQRPRGIFKACRFYYLHQIRRGNVIGTLVRGIKVAIIWSWIGIEAVFRRLTGSTKTTQSPQAPQSTASPTSQESDDRLAA